MAEVTLRDALESIEANQITERKKGLEDLKYILRHSQNSGKISSLGDDSHHRIFEALFQAALKEQAASTKGASEATRTAAANRLTDIAATLRQWIESSVTFLTKVKTIRAVYDHVIDTMCYSGGGFCEPLALEYAKCLRVLFSYQPHVERLGDDWDRNVDFVIQVIKEAGEQTKDDNAVPATPGITSSISYRSSRSAIRDPAGSQGSRFGIRAIIPEMIACLQLLTSAPNAPLEHKSQDVFKSIVKFLQTSSVSSAANHDAFNTVNNILSWSRTEAISLTEEHTSALLRLISNYWSSKSNAADQMLMTLLLLRPYYMHKSQQPVAQTIRSELSRLFQILLSEYSKRLDRDRLGMDDLRLKITRNPDLSSAEISTGLFELRCCGIRAESNWLLLYSLASIHRSLMTSNAETEPADSDHDQVDETDPNPRHRKRQRTDDHLADLLRSASHGSPQSRMSAIQVLAFVAQQQAMTARQMAKILSILSTICSEENVTAASWALLTLACFASQASATEARLASHWATLWQVACRSISNASLCRPAAYALHIMASLHLVARPAVSELVNTITNAMDLSGPSLPSDAASCFLNTILRAAQQTNPASSSATAESILQWLTRTIIPSRFEDKAFAMGTATYDVSDIISLLHACLRQDNTSAGTTAFRIWEQPGRTWLLCRGHDPLVSYLLLGPSEGSVMHRDLEAGLSLSPTNIVPPPLSSELIILSHFTTELTRTLTAWQEMKQDRRHVNLDSFTMLCKLACLIVDVANSFTFRDAHKLSQLQDQASTLLNTLSGFVSTTGCDDAKADVFFLVFSVTLPGLHLCRQTRKEDHHDFGASAYHPSGTEKLVSRALASASLSRRDLTQDHVDQDSLDLDDEFESQASGQGPQGSETCVLTNDLEIGFGKLAMRDSIALYAHAVVALSDEEVYDDLSEPISSRMIDYLQKSPTTLFICRDIIKAFPYLGINFVASDVSTLLGGLMKTIKKHTYARSEVSLGACLDILLSQATIWMDPDNQKLYKFGLDLYDWWTVGQLGQGTMSPNVQKRLADLLVRLCQIQEDYAADEPEASTPRTCLFKLLSQGRITLQFHLADKIPIIFKSFILPTHEAIFDDLQSSLSEDIGSVEGMALRLLVLANLGSEWPSLLRRCVYYIFDAAGRAPSSSRHATFCVNQLASRLPIKSAKRLFSIFAPQLLYTWLNSKETLTKLPYAAFQYSSLKELLTVNEAEVAAQLVLHDATEDMNVMSNALATLPGDILRRSYPKALAYAIGRDISLPPGTAIVENRLKTLVGGKDNAKELTLSSFPNVMGHLYLIMQQDDVGDEWLGKKSAYAYASRALAEIKRHSCSQRRLPRFQQPSFPSSHFIEQLERLNRRIGHNEGTPWDSSWFPLVARMLLNAVDESLGSLNTSLMVRRLRTLVSLAGEAVFQGFSLEMLVHSLLPFLSDRECADDVLGILWYLFDHGRKHLSTNLPFLRGAIMLLVLQMRSHSRAKQDHMTQQSRHKATVERMAGFQDWLVAYLRGSIGDRPKSSDIRLVDALGPLRLPGNARKETPESSLLLFLLDQRSLADPLCSPADIREAISLLSDDFEAPSSVSDDCLGDDASASRYSHELWQTVQGGSLSKQLVTWAAQVVGRSYASKGIRPNQGSAHSVSQRQQNISKDLSEGKIISASQHTIAERVVELLFSRDCQEAGLADLCLRTFYELEGESADDLNEFEQMLPGSVVDAIRGGAFHYQPPFAMRSRSPPKTSIKALRETLATADTSTLAEWTTSIALNLCFCTSKLPQVEMLAPLFQQPSTLAVEMLPSMIHLLLYKEVGVADNIRSSMSSALASCLSQMDSKVHAKQRFFLDLLVYLRGQPYPNEETKSDRLRWLDFDCLQAAKAGARCGKPTSALLFAELEDPVPVQAPQANKRSSTCSSQVLKPAVSDDLLLSIYERMEEPDSFYGVEQPASLASVLNRLDHEADGFKSLMFRSAQMDSNMRNSQELGSRDAVGMVHSLSNLSFNSLTLSLLSKGLENSADSPEDMLNAAKSLQQWDISIPEAHNAESFAIFNALQELSRATSLSHAQTRVQSAIVEHADRGIQIGKSMILPHSWFGVLSQLTETAELLASKTQAEIEKRWQLIRARNNWMHLAKFEDASPIVANRQILFGVLRRNTHLSLAMRLNRKQCSTLEAESLLDTSKFAREHSRLQEALTAMTSLDNMNDHFATLDLNITGAIKYETASVLWDAGEAAASVKMLRDVLSSDDIDKQDIAMGRAGLYAQLGHQLAEARLEKPEAILSHYLKPAISHLNKRKLGDEAGKVYHEFAAFCDNELQSASNRENIDRIVKNRQGMEQKIEGLEQSLKNIKRTGGDKSELMKSYGAAKKWLEIDSAEEKRLIKERRGYVHQSLQNYLLALQASDNHDLGVLRFFALWLENCEDEEANSIALKYIQEVPSWKFVLLMNQLMSRVSDEASTFQLALQQLLVRICGEHPHHSLHHLFAARSNMGGDVASQSRYNAAMEIHAELMRNPKQKGIVDNIFRMDGHYDGLANWDANQRNSSKITIKDSRDALAIASLMPKMHLPPVTMTIALRPSGRYDDMPVVTRYESRISVMSGNSAPKAVSCQASDGVSYRQLFKSGDDLRQDAIMEQVFEEVSKMLRNHKATRQRDLKVRTYKVVPLSSKSGIIEFVPNSIPLNDFLRPAHRKYNPTDYTNDQCRQLVDNCFKNGKSVEERVKVYRKCCDNMRPVLRHFFFERFNDPDEWFQKRTAYTRTTASISILGYILGLGDRHNSNIMLDQGTGEVVHIDLGVAFEAGRVLPIPELVPFRLTRDIVDGMGVTKTEGVFRRCCEFTLDAVREDKGSIMTLLNVLRYDPLYSWQSNARAKKAQGGGRDEMSSKKREQEAGEADRALSIVERKLDKTLSTAAMVNELIQQAVDERNLGTLFCGWAAWF